MKKSAGRDRVHEVVQPPSRRDPRRIPRVVICNRRYIRSRNSDGGGDGGEGRLDEGKREEEGYLDEREDDRKGGRTGRESGRRGRGTCREGA